MLSPIFRTTCCILIALVTSTQLHGQAADGAGQNILENGGFDDVSGKFYAGWDQGGFVGGKPGTTEMWKNTAEAASETDGTPFLRVSCIDPDGADFAVFTKERISLNPAWTSLTVKGEAKTESYVPLASWGGRAMIECLFFDANDEQLKGEFFIEIPSEATAWTEVEKVIQIPPGSATVKVAMHIIGANAVVDFRKLQVLPE